MKNRKQLKRATGLSPPDGGRDGTLLHCPPTDWLPTPLTAIPSFLMLRLKSWSHHNSFFFSHPSQPTANPVGSILKIHPESNHFPPLPLQPPASKPPLSLCWVMRVTSSLVSLLSAPYSQFTQLALVQSTSECSPPLLETLQWLLHLTQNKFQGPHYDLEDWDLSPAPLGLHSFCFPFSASSASFLPWDASP